MRKAIPLWKFATEGKHAGYMVHVANPELWRPAMFHELPAQWRFDGPRAYPVSPTTPTEKVQEAGRALAALLIESITRSARSF